MILNLISNGVREEIHSEMWRIELTIRPFCLTVCALLWEIPGVGIEIIFYIFLWLFSIRAKVHILVALSKNMRVISNLS